MKIFSIIKSITIIVWAVFSLSSCTSRIGDENFDEFRTKFFTDEEFQMSRIKFPVGIYLDCFPDPIETEFTPKNWKELSKNALDYTYNNYSIVKISDGLYELEWTTDGGGYGCNMRFEIDIEERVYYLVKFNIWNLV